MEHGQGERGATRGSAERALLLSDKPDLRAGQRLTEQAALVVAGGLHVREERQRLDARSAGSPIGGGGAAK